MRSYINFPIFILAFICGLFLIRLSADETEIVLVYPTPNNSGKINYKDKAGNCYYYRSKKVNCPEKGYKKIPIQ